MNVHQIATSTNSSTIRKKKFVTQEFITVWGNGKYTMCMNLQIC